MVFSPSNAKSRPVGHTRTIRAGGHSEYKNVVDIWQRSYSLPPPAQCSPCCPGQPRVSRHNPQPAATASLRTAHVRESWAGRSARSSVLYAATPSPAEQRNVRLDGKVLTHNDVEAQHGNLQATEDLEAEAEVEAAAFLRRAHLRAASFAVTATGH